MKKFSSPILSPLPLAVNDPPPESDEWCELKAISHIGEAKP